MSTNKREIEITNQVVMQAQDGNAWMQYQLASYLYVGDKQKAPNIEQGFRWMQASAENGCVKAQKVLGLLYTNGQHAPWPEKDLEEAVYWYGQAADAGDGEAMYWLSCCYQKGIGVVYDEEAAAYWLKQARIHGYDVEEEDDSEQKEIVSEEGGMQEALDEEQPLDMIEPETDEYSPEEASTGKWWHKKRDVQEKGLDIAQEGVIFTPKHDIEYAKSAAVYGVIAFSVGVIVCCLAAVFVNIINPKFFESSARGAFLVLSGALCLALGGFAFRNGYISAYEENKRCAWFRNTPFYNRYQVDYEQLGAEDLMRYEYYSALEKVYKPCSKQDMMPRSLFRESRGYMFMGMYFGERGASASPDFVIITEKSVYVIECVQLQGRIRGAVDEPDWQVTMPGGVVRKMANPILQNERRIQIIKRECSHICPWAVTDVVPFYSMVMLNQDADIRGLTGPRKEGDTHVLQMSGEELRGYMEVLESKNSLMEAETLELAKAFEQIAGEFDKRKAVYGKEGL